MIEIDGKNWSEVPLLEKIKVIFFATINIICFILMTLMVFGITFFIDSKSIDHYIIRLILVWIAYIGILYVIYINTKITINKRNEKI